MYIYTYIHLQTEPWTGNSKGRLPLTQVLTRVSTCVYVCIFILYASEYLCICMHIHSLRK